MTDTAELSPSATIPAAVALLEQCRDFLRSIDDDAYTRPAEVMHGGTIGQHVRHTLDHYSAALNALEDEIIDYDTRRRGTPVESSRTEALRTLDVLTSLIHAAPPNQADRLVSVRIMLSGDGASTELTSTFARELAFATHHAVHHNAMIGAIASSLGIAPPEGFGKAPSTIHHERSVGRAVPAR